MRSQQLFLLLTALRLLPSAFKDNVLNDVLNDVFNLLGFLLRYLFTPSFVLETSSTRPLAHCEGTVAFSPGLTLTFYTHLTGGGGGGGDRTGQESWEKGLEQLTGHLCSQIELTWIFPSKVFVVCCELKHMKQHEILRIEQIKAEYVQYIYQQRRETLCFLWFEWTDPLTEMFNFMWT